MNALAITDHGNLYGALEFYQACRERGHQSDRRLRGVCRARQPVRRSVGRDRANRVIISRCWRRIAPGFENLVQALEQGVSGRLLSQAADRSRAAGGAQRRAHLPERLRVGRVEPHAALGQHGRRSDCRAAKSIAAWFHRVFGDRYFIEIQNNGARNSAAGAGAFGRRWRSGWACRSWRRATPTTCGARMRSRRTCCCASTRASSAPTRIGCGWRATSSSSAARRKCTRRFAGLEDAVARSQQIADSVDMQLELGKRHFPDVRAAGRERRRPSICASCAKRACASGTRTIRAAGRTTIRNRASSATKCASGSTASCDVIEKLGFCDYFLIVWDFVRYAIEQKHSLHGPRLGRRLARVLRAARSATSARCNTTCCSSGFSMRTAAKRPISTSTSARIAAAKSFST